MDFEELFHLKASERLRETCAAWETYCQQVVVGCLIIVAFVLCRVVRVTEANSNGCFQVEHVADGCPGVLKPIRDMLQQDGG
jgi:hypothetical protein